MSLQMGLSSPSQHHLLLKPTHSNPLYTARKSKPQISFTRTRTTTTALLSSTKEAVLKDFHHNRALKVYSLCLELIVMYAECYNEILLKFSYYEI